MTITPWEKLHEDRASFGHRQYFDRTYRRRDGTTVDFQVKEEPDATAILAFTVEGDVLLVRQFRPGPEIVVDELPGGVVEPGESEVDAAQRELLEETGYAAGELRYVATSLDCAYSTRRRHSFLATDCVWQCDPEGDGVEELEAVTISLATFREHLRSGALTDAGAGYRCLDAAGLL